MVHQYKLNGYNIVLDTCSGSVHTVDEVAYDIIAMYKEKTEEKIVKEILCKYKDLPDVTEEEINKQQNITTTQTEKKRPQRKIGTKTESRTDIKALHNIYQCPYLRLNKTEHKAPP